MIENNQPGHSTTVCDCSNTNIDLPKNNTWSTWQTISQPTLKDSDVNIKLSAVQILSDMLENTALELETRKLIEYKLVQTIGLL